MSVIKIILAVVVSFLFNVVPGKTQSNPNFNVDLAVSYESAERVLDLCDGRFVNPQEIANLRGNKIAAATAQYIANRSNDPVDLLCRYLDSLKEQEPIEDDLYHLKETRARAADIHAFLNEIQKSNFNRKVIATIEQLFPPNARVTVSVPVYFVAFGHENVDAYVRRIVWHGSEPQFVGEHEGEVTIVVNLAKAIDYPGAMKEKIVQLLGVVAHETFHAVFGAYKDDSPTWQRFYAGHRKPFDALMDLAQNEGIAYYLSLEEEGRGYLPRDWNTRTTDLFARFNRNASALLSDSLSPRRAEQLLRDANLSGGDWQSYGALAGMVMARSIEHVLGRPALVETVALGPIDFFQKYIAATERQGDLPRLNQRIVDALSRK